MDMIYQDIINEFSQNGDYFLGREGGYVYFFSKNLADGTLLLEDNGDTVIIWYNELTCISFSELYKLFVERINVPLYVVNIASKEESDAILSLGGESVDFYSDDCDEYDYEFGSYKLVKNRKSEILDFKTITLKDVERIRKYLPYATNILCDNTVGGILMWREYYSMEYAESNDTLIIKILLRHYDKADMVAFYLPLGKDRHGAFSKIEEYCDVHSLAVVYCLATKEELPHLSETYENFQLSYDSDWSDYVYRASDMLALSGRKYHGQKNHINYFKRTNTVYSFEEISKNNIREVQEFYNRFTQSRGKDSAMYYEERDKTLEVLQNYNLYGLIGGLIRIDDSVAAFSIGEVCNNTLFVHIEKADLRYKGIYQVINNEFAKHYVSHEVEFINRGEDVGDEGLRKAKSSYHPFAIVDKYIVMVNS